MQRIAVIASLEQFAAWNPPHKDFIQNRHIGRVVAGDVEYIRVNKPEEARSQTFTSMLILEPHPFDETVKAIQARLRCFTV